MSKASPVKQIPLAFTPQPSQEIIMPNAHAQIVSKVRDELKRYDVQSVAKIALVSPSTLYKWLDESTQKPRIDTLVRVTQAIGMRLDVKKQKKTHLRQVA